MVKKVLAVLFFALSFTPFSAAYACSGGSPSTLKELLHDADTVVRGVMEYVDAEGQNGILRVEKILAGDRVPQRIVLALYPAARIQRDLARTDSGGCWSGVSRLSTDETIIIFLKRLPNGAYELALPNRLNPAYYAFLNPHTAMNVFYTGAGEALVMSENYPQPPSTKPFELPAFEQLITDLAATHSLRPLMTAPPPLPTSLYIRTVSGIEYELPVDFSSPKQLDSRLADVSGSITRTGCSTVNCIGTSPNGVDTAQVMPDSTIQILSFVGSQVSGNAFRFSTTSDALVVWDTDTLTVYALPYDRLGFCCFELTFINSIGINNGVENTTNVAWSPDGRMLAYGDRKGLYLWDVFTVGSRPHLLETVLSAPVTPRFFSLTGRYLAVQRGEKRLYLDIVSQTELLDGALSADDRNLLQFDTWQASALSLYRLAPIQNRNRFDHYQHVRQAEWIDENRFIIADCPPLQPDACSVWTDSLRIGGGHFKGFTFAFDKVSETIAIAQTADRIGILTNGYNYRTYDLSATLDSDIQAIHWMPPIFFEP